MRRFGCKCKTWGLWLCSSREICSKERNTFSGGIFFSFPSCLLPSSTPKTLALSLKAALTFCAYLSVFTPISLLHELSSSCHGASSGPILWGILKVITAPLFSHTFELGSVCAPAQLRGHSCWRVWSLYARPVPATSLSADPAPGARCEWPHTYLFPAVGSEHLLLSCRVMKGEALSCSFS